MGQGKKSITTVIAQTIFKKARKGLFKIKISLIIWGGICFSGSSFFYLSIVGTQCYVCYNAFRCTMKWFNSSILYNVIIPLVLVIITHLANLSQYYWLDLLHYFTYPYVPYPLVSVYMKLFCFVMFVHFLKISHVSETT